MNTKERKHEREDAAPICEATLSGLGSKGLDEREAHEKLRARKEELKKLEDDDDIIKHDKHHPTNLLSRPSPGTFADRDTIVTAVTRTQPSPSLSTNPPQTPHLQPTVDTEREYTTLRTPPSTRIEPKPVQPEQRTGTLSDDDRKAGTRSRRSGKHPPHVALLEHDKEHDNEISAHEVVHATTLTVEFPLNDTAPGEYNPPPPPPICDTTQIPQVGPIKKHSDEHDEHVLALVVTDAIELSTSMSIGAIAVAAATAEAAAVATAAVAATPPRTTSTAPLLSELNCPHFPYAFLPMSKPKTPMSNPKT
ncbi:hypothetical protein PILCRDRAFT_884 [Piloderma croceum F 1598]|uniref:Uncharacterized protein n=1 Tax=Piloderma croceum (strain F 1598) TaxID=765440 RepID=A0A0C3BYZ2_PILCF|nr:hypothetical protein PILCRDRAFT_884 [Piloderma croceum F 1598]